MFPVSFNIKGKAPHISGKYMRIKGMYHRGK
jgi:hypothetical protein